MARRAWWTLCGGGAWQCLPLPVIHFHTASTSGSAPPYLHVLVQYIAVLPILINSSFSPSPLVTVTWWQCLLLPLLYFHTASASGSTPPYLYLLVLYYNPCKSRVWPSIIHFPTASASGATPHYLCLFVQYIVVLVKYQIPIHTSWTVEHPSLPFLYSLPHSQRLWLSTPLSLLIGSLYYSHCQSRVWPSIIHFHTASASGSTPYYLCLFVQYIVILVSTLPLSTSTQPVPLAQHPTVITFGSGYCNLVSSTNHKVAQVKHLVSRISGQLSIFSFTNSHCYLVALNPQLSFLFCPRYSSLVSSNKIPFHTSWTVKHSIFSSSPSPLVLLHCLPSIHLNTASTSGSAPNCHHLLILGIAVLIKHLPVPSLNSHPRSQNLWLNTRPSLLIRSVYCSSCKAQRIKLESICAYQLDCETFPFEDFCTPIFIFSIPARPCHLLAVPLPSLNSHTFTKPAPLSQPLTVVPFGSRYYSSWQCLPLSSIRIYTASTFGSTPNCHYFWFRIYCSPCEALIMSVRFAQGRPRSLSGAEPATVDFSSRVNEEGQKTDFPRQRKGSLCSSAQCAPPSCLSADGHRRPLSSNLETGNYLRNYRFHTQESHSQPLHSKSLSQDLSSYQSRNTNCDQTPKLGRSLQVPRTQEQAYLDSTSGRHTRARSLSELAALRKLGVANIISHPVSREGAISQDCSRSFPRQSIVQIKKALIDTVDSYQCGLQEKLIVVAKLHSEVEAELIQLTNLSEAKKEVGSALALLKHANRTKALALSQLGMLNTDVKHNCQKSYRQW
ncbi:hypothetical protein O181_031251 [Austropuccinia psidii MF-1]|uniref:Uncharacterized protein n=1 Tax=Austropuccinia psidii MF-1 TaxID=1389203 RepID=A0A9Q3CUH4_9BASI|nr:hypothetical protein [Austropuccinia psidii MF-1]